MKGSLQVSCVSCVVCHGAWERLIDKSAEASISRSAVNQASFAQCECLSLRGVPLRLSPCQSCGWVGRGDGGMSAEC